MWKLHKNNFLHLHKIQSVWAGHLFWTRNWIHHTYSLLFWKTFTNQGLTWRREHTLWYYAVCIISQKILCSSLHYSPRGLPPSVQSAARPIIGLPSWESSFSWSHWLLYTLNLHTIYIIYKSNSHSFVTRYKSSLRYYVGSKVHNI